MRARLLFVCYLVCLLLVSVSDGLAQTPADWPVANAEWTIRILKESGLEMEDDRWMHLHHGHGGTPDAPNVTLKVLIYRTFDHFNTLPPEKSGLEIRYLARGVAVSGWLPPPFVFTLNIDNPALDTLRDGFHDISLEARGANYLNFKPDPCFLHITRGRPLETTVPVITGEFDAEGHSLYGHGVTYVNPNERSFYGHPTNPFVTPWHTPPHETDLYLEEMAPHAGLFESVQMWWEDPPHPGHPFARGFPPKHGEDHRALRVTDQHQRFPFRDGPRGIGWMSGYVSGQVDSQGRLVFAEAGGRVARLWPDGRIETLAGWTVRPGKDPVWPTKPLDVIRGNMELRGRWREGRYPDGDGFRTPLDVALDPRHENIIYVAGYEDNCIWKIELPTARKGSGAPPRIANTVTVFAGDPNHSAGFTNATGHAARFDGPASLVFDPVSDALYVADQNNDAIRKITRDGVVTTLFGGPGMADRLRQRGVQDVYDQIAARPASNFEVTAAQAAAGMRPDVYVPQCLRARSNGDLVLLELGYGALRLIKPNTGETRKLGEVQQPHGEFRRGWAWFDVDRWGKAGPRDGIYWCKFVGDSIDGETGSRFNEIYAWLPPEGGGSRFIFGPPIEAFPDGWGKRAETNPPHYPWLVAVDPRGAVLLAGGGEHGACRLRLRREYDPVPDDPINLYEPAEQLWKNGGNAPRLPSFALKYGWGVHNYLGLRDAWELYGDESDETLLNYFDAPNAIRNNPTDRLRWLYYVRQNMGPR